MLILPIHESIYASTYLYFPKCYKQPKYPSVNKWIKKLWYIYTMEYYAAERKEFLPFGSAWMELENDYAKWNKPISERQIPHDLTQPNEQNKLMSKIEPEVWKQRTDWQWPEGRGKEDNGGKKGKGLVKEHVWMTHRHGQQSEEWLWEWGGGLGGGGQREKIGTTLIE